jgi:hypothetical protein
VSVLESYLDNCIREISVLETSVKKVSVFERFICTTDMSVLERCMYYSL